MQDRRVDTVRGQAFVDWLNSIGPPAAATTYTLTGPATDVINVPVLFSVQPNGTFTGTITVTPSGGGLTAPYSHTWTGGSETWAFAVVPVQIGTVTLTPSNDGGLLDPSALSLTVLPAPSPPPLFKFVLGRKVIKNVLLSIPK
jgi:hypothetical protein